MERKAQSGQVIVELVLVSLVIGLLFIFLMESGVMTRDQLAMTRFSGSSTTKQASPFDGWRSQGGAR